ncbi:MAG: glycosyltransferase [Flavobacterium sp.]|nr:MAG: glycosyltransferase [Flavobacterium sp.]
MQEINIWGIKVNPLTKAEIVKRIDDHVAVGNSTFHLTGVNPETIAQAQSDPRLKDSINSSNLVNIDNTLVMLTLRLLGYHIPERAACPDIFEQLLMLSNQKGYSVYFLGAQQEVLQDMQSKIIVKYPSLKIAGARNGYFRPEQEEDVIKEIRAISPDMLFIAFPTPRKELFINKYKHLLGVRFAFGVGGAFDVQAGKVVRAPLWMRKIGLEGTHRALQNPLNYGARYLKYYFPFVKLFLRAKFQ